MIRVIIADDEPKVCQLIQNITNWNDYDMEIVGIANNGVDALDMIEKYSPDLVVTDIRMPGFDGIELIRRAKELNPNMDFIIISGYRHFDYAQNAIRYGVSDYLLKPIKKNELESTLAKMAQRYKERLGKLSAEEALKHRRKIDIERLRLVFFNELIQNASKDKTHYELSRVNSEYHYKFQQGCFQIIAIKPDIGYKSNFDNRGKFLNEKIKQIVENSFSSVCHDLQLFSNEKEVYCLFNFQPENKDILRKLYRGLIGEILLNSSMFEHLEITVGLGELVDCLEAVPQSYESAVAAIKQRIVDGTGRVIEKPCHTGKINISSLINPECTKRLGTLVELLDRDAVNDFIRKLKTDVEAFVPLIGQDVFSLVTDFFRLFLYQLLSKGYKVSDEKELFAEFSQKADQCSSIKMLFEYLEASVDSILRDLINDKIQSVVRPIRQAKQYIQENYMKPITLDEVSSLVGFNATYFSTIFKKETNSSFVEYLTQVRMEAAKELLRETRLSVAEICERVGYSDLKHFTKKFISIAGVKPSEYRRLYS